MAMANKMNEAEDVNECLLSLALISFLFFLTQPHSKILSYVSLGAERVNKITPKRPQSKDKQELQSLD